MTEAEEEKFWSNHFVCVNCGYVFDNKEIDCDNGIGLICKLCNKGVNVE